ncbi:MAG TPA: hypothetical protein QKA14_02830 [Candidatus Megaira endosymbiont of Hartmannula sinica]|nr:hypothetical protein [Candidatus Megaera endosymbiont of Hartmannula sinica]
MSKKRNALKGYSALFISTMLTAGVFSAQLDNKVQAADLSTENTPAIIGVNNGLEDFNNGDTIQYVFDHTVKSNGNHNINI